MAIDNKKIAADVLAAVGGKENVSMVTHCMTRLRFNLKDASIPKDEEIKNIPGVAGVMVAGGQYQVIIGQNVPKVYAEVCKLGGFSTKSVLDEDLDKPKEKLTAKKIGNNIMNYLAGSMTPLIPLMMAAGMCKMLLTLLGSSMLGIIADDSNLAILLDFCYDAGFYFLPIYIGYTAAKKLNTSIPMGLLMGGILLAPDFMALAGAETAFTVYGIPCQVNDYSSTVMPILLSVWVMHYIYSFFGKRIPTAVSTIFTPFFTILVMLPLELCVLAPLGSIAGNYLAIGMNWLGVNCGFLAVAIIGALYMPLVITGMHVTLVVMSVATLFSTGSENLLFVGSFAATAACAGMSLGAFLRLKNKSEKAMCGGYFASIFLSAISEPSLYGIAVRYRRPFLGLIAGGFAGGLYAGITQVTFHTLISSTVLAPLCYAAGGTTNLINGTISLVIGFVVSLLITYFFGFSKEDLEADRRTALERN